MGAFAALLFFQAVALADSVGSDTAVGAIPVTLPSGWAGLVMLALVAASWALRKYTDVPFFHTTLGAAVMGILSSAIPSLIDGIKARGLTVAVVQTAFYGALLSFFASDNASSRNDEQKQRVAAMRARRAPQPPPPVRPGSMGILLPLGLAIGLAAIPSCNTPGGQALAKCELGTLPSAAGTMIANLVAIAFSGGDYQQQLEQAAMQAAKNNAGPQFDCAVAAVSAWLDSSTPRGQVSPARLDANAAFKAYVAKHRPVACGPVKIQPRCVPLYSLAYNLPRG
jgi:hypothetical protein